MARKQDQARLANMYQAVNQYPGEKPGFFARLFGWQRSDVTRMLPGLEDSGYLLYEDERGGLWPFRKR